MRRPCEHGRYEQHWFPTNFKSTYPNCPGGHPVEAEKVWWCDVYDEGKLERFDFCAPDFPDQEGNHGKCGERFLIPLPNMEGEK